MSLLRLIIFICSISTCMFVWGVSFDDRDGLPGYYSTYLADRIRMINKDKSPSFIFITDTHVTANRMRSPMLIKEITERTSIKKVVWGGDAIPAYGNEDEIKKCWKKQLLFDSLIVKDGQLYKIRGNHDFTIKENRFSSVGVTYSQVETARLLMGNCPDDVVSNSVDAGACYYYFDDKKNKLRYVVFDTTDSVKSTNVPWGTIYGVHDTQLKWVADSAIASTPEGFGLVFFSHVPFTDTTGARHEVLSNIRELVDAAALKTAGKIGLINYDFSKLKHVDVLLVMSGHNHQDMQTYRNGVVHVVTSCDTAYDDYKADPFVKDLSGMKKGTVNEQCFDCVTIDRRKRLVKNYRIGIGGNRYFHTKPILLNIGRFKRIKTSFVKKVEWYSYNANGNKYNGMWTLYNNIVNVSQDGIVYCRKAGEAVVLAVDAKGNKEFFNIIVRE